MSGGTNWPDAHLRELIRDYPSKKVTVDELSTRFGRTPDAVKSKAKALGLKRPVWSGGGRPKGIAGPRKFVSTPYRQPVPRPAPEPTPPPEMPSHPFWTPKLDVDVFRSGGKYAEIASIAERIGRPHSYVLQRFHRLQAEVS